MRKEYTAADVRNPVRGKYWAAYRRGVNVVVLDPDVSAAFPSDRAVNDALRAVIAAGAERKSARRPARRVGHRKRA